MNRPEPAMRLLSLGAGVQSTTLFLLAAEGRLPGLDAAVFADTGFEPAAVYEHLDRLEKEVAIPAGIPIYRVSSGNIRDDALNPEARYAQMPLYVRGAHGGKGMLRRACTAEYKVKPIKAKVRELLGYPHPTPVPKGVFVEQWIGISIDEVGRAASSASDVNYMRMHFPLIDLPGGTPRYGNAGWTRNDCIRYLGQRGWSSTPKSACVACPFHGNAQWRTLRDQHPADWAAAVDFDRRIRNGYPRAIANGDPLHGEAFLHRSRVPLDQAPIGRVTQHEWKQAQTDVYEQIADAEAEDEVRGCSPWVCRGDDEEDAA